ncbi:hypothetical protein [Prevotella sp. OH937_COT-195]|nr:hypothetical protein [Prevotella sp. OH937_COT-195]
MLLPLRFPTALARLLNICAAITSRRSPQRLLLNGCTSAQQSDKIG